MVLLSFIQRKKGSVAGIRKKSGHIVVVCLFLTKIAEYKKFITENIKLSTKQD